VRGVCQGKSWLENTLLGKRGELSGESLKEASWAWWEGGSHLPRSLAKCEGAPQRGRTKKRESRRARPPQDLRGEDGWIIVDGQIQDYEAGGKKASGENLSESVW